MKTVGDTKACARHKTAIAFETGNIQGLTEKVIADSDSYALNRIPDGQFDQEDGGVDTIENVRYSLAPVGEHKYVDPTISGQEDGTMPGRDCQGGDSDIDTTIDSRGAAGCRLPAKTIHGGYDEFGQIIRAAAFDAGPWCLWDFVKKPVEHVNAFINMLRKGLPMVGRDNFEYALERLVIENGHYNTAIVNGTIYNQGSFPVAPEGILCLETVRRMYPILKAHGWTGMMEVQVGSDAFEQMKLKYKRDRGIELQETIVAHETHHLGPDTKVVEWGGVRWIISELPPRGYLRDIPGGGKEFVRVYPSNPRAGTGGGVVATTNDDYYSCSTWCDGAKRELYEVGMFIHPIGAKREGMAGAQMPGKQWAANKFNFEVEMLDRENGGLTDCNVDNFSFALRMLHVFQFKSLNPELIGGILYRVSPECPTVTAPCCDDQCDDLEIDAVSMADAPPLEHDSCSSSDDDECDTSIEHFVPEPDGAGGPVNVAGAIQVVTTTIVTDLNGGSVVVYVERVGGTDGASTVKANANDGTGAAGVDYTDIAEATLSWADGEAGRKSVTIPILSSGTGDKDFTVDLTGVTNSTLAADADQTVVEIEQPCSSV